MRRRNDGRSLNQLRNIKIKTGIDHTVDGSCIYNQGLTEVICFIRGPRAVIYEKLFREHKTT